MTAVDKRRKCKLRGLIVWLIGMFIMLSSNIVTTIGRPFGVEWWSLIIVGFVVSFPVRALVERKCRGGCAEEADEKRPFEIEGGKQENVEIY